jgi:hypothetical protein
MSMWPTLCLNGKRSCRGNLESSSTLHACLLIQSFLSKTYSKSLANKLNQEDLVLLTSRWWPYADRETLVDLAHFVACIFSVDGLIDDVSGPSKDDMKAFHALYESTEAFAEQELESSKLEEIPASLKSTIDTFRVLSELLSKRYTFGEPP